MTYVISSQKAEMFMKMCSCIRSMLRTTLHLCKYDVEHKLQILNLHISTSKSLMGISNFPTKQMHIQGTTPNGISLSASLSPLGACLYFARIRLMGSLRGVTVYFARKKLTCQYNKANGYMQLSSRGL